jgi:hypothetical protein
MFSRLITLFLVLVSTQVFAQTKILFDCTKAETAGQADWIIDADVFNLNWNPNAYTGSSNWHSNAQKIPTPAQSGITLSTNENYWTGGISAWAVDCAKKGYMVETLPWNGQITYGNGSNAQDLSNYKVFVVCEPNIMFTASEKTAMMNFVQNGGGLFIVSDHNNSDRNGDGYDSPNIWNDFFTNNSVQANPFGITFDLQDFSGTYNNMAGLPSTDSILHGTMGSVTQVKWSNGTSMTLNTTNNATVKAVCYKTGTSGNTNVLFAYARYGNGKVCAIGDSSPCDDGTGNPSSNLTLYNGYFTDAAGNHQKLLMNATIWLATGNSSSITATITPAGNPTFCQGGSVVLNANTGAGYTYQWKLNNSAISGATSASYTATQAGNYTVTINGTATSMITVVVVNPLPTPTVVNTANTLSVAGGPYSAYVWYLNGSAISGATNATYVATQNGNYKVYVTTSAGCSAYATQIAVTIVGVSEVSERKLSIHPNPTNGLINIDGVTPSTIQVFSTDGRLMKEEHQKTVVSIAELPEGIYYLQLWDAQNNLLLKEKLVKR